MYDYIIHERAYITRLLDDFVCNFRDFKSIFALFHKFERLSVQNSTKVTKKPPTGLVLGGYMKKVARMCVTNFRR